MRSTLISLAFVAFAAASPRPQSLDLKAIEAAPDPTLKGPPVGAVEQTTVYDPKAAAASATAVAALPSRVARRDFEVGTIQKRGVNDPCAPQPSGLVDHRRDVGGSLWMVPSSVDKAILS